MTSYSSPKPHSSPPLARPSLNLTPAEPVLSRPSLPRSLSAIEPFTSNNLLLPPASTHRRPTSLTSSSSTTNISLTTNHPPSLISHHRNQSVEPILAFSTPISIALSCPPSNSLQALLQRTLEEDHHARSWADSDDDDLTEHVSSHPILNPLPNPTNHHHILHHPHTFSQPPMDPVLADLEAKSRLNVQTECAICHKKGINYPKCPKCQLEFCSRDCRVSMGDGQRHRCA